MKKLLIFGASGPTGKQLVSQALEAGHEVTAVVRNPAKLEMKHERLQVVTVDALKPGTFASHLAGKDAVLSALGATQSGPTTIYSEGTANIVNAMRAAGLKRLIVVTSDALDVKNAEGASWLMRWLVGTVLHSMLKNSYDDMRRMEEYLKTIDLDWTIMRPAKLNNKPVSGKYYVALNKNEVRSWQTSRADLAHYMLSIIDDSSTFKGIATIT